MFGSKPSAPSPADAAELGDLREDSKSPAKRWRNSFTGVSGMGDVLRRMSSSGGFEKLSFAKAHSLARTPNALALRHSN